MLISDVSTYLVSFAGWGAYVLESTIDQDYVLCLLIFGYHSSSDTVYCKALTA